VANIFKTVCTDYYQNQLKFVEDMTKMTETVWLTFSLDKV